MRSLATGSVLILGLLGLLAPGAAASTQRISITFAVEGAGPGAGAATQIYDERNRFVGCHVPFTSPPTCGTNEIPRTQAAASGSTITFVDNDSPSTRCFRVHANDTDGPGNQPPTPTSVRATFTNPDGSQHTVGPFRMENGTRIYVGSTPPEPGLSPGGPPPTGAGCSAQSTGGDVPECSDGRDNDGDRRVDFPQDIGCKASDDYYEENEECDAIGRGLTVKLGTAGRDILNGSSGLDELRGLGGADVLNGRGDGDCLYGGSGRDRIRGGAGRDHVLAGPGNDRANGGRGNDSLEGEVGHDALFGGPGRDLLEGSSGNDRLVGGRGADHFQGFLGNDRIDARDGGRDIVACGPGRDVAIVDGRDFVWRLQPQSVVGRCEKVVRAR